MERPISGSDILLFIDPAAGTSWDLIVCLTSQSYKRTLDEIDASSKCGTKTLPSNKKKRTISVAGQVQLEPGANRISEADLDDLFEDKTIFTWKYGPTIPVTGDVTYTGKGFFTDLEVSADDKSSVSFTANISVTETPTKTIT